MLQRYGARSSGLGFLSLSILLALILVYSPGVAAVGQEQTGRTLVIGKISANPKKHYGFLKPIADYAVSRMGDLGYTSARVVMAEDASQMARYLRRGQVDWVTETPFSSVILNRKSGAEYLLRKWKKGVAEYHSVFFVRKDSGIRGLEDLRIL
ncbi:MAG: phosphate/phosphite/phosphonate ABC transporter substrate-binding protein [Motiliproteus sp.]|nr:phosphate/phosphite/phosphonate ABC transporter substrate-binding protein [Motiliproteus sp.]